jgi:DNA invertase Pin-like site-specific DNA recombinase
MPGLIAAYVRVSSKSQTDKMQRAAIERAASTRNEEIASWYADRLSGDALHRPDLARLLSDTRQGVVRRLYVYRLDRLTRRGIRDTLEIVDELGRHGCELVTLADGFDMAGPAAEVVIAVLSWAAKLERLAINERIAAARVRVEGIGGHWGRPHRMTTEQSEACLNLAAEGVSVRSIAQRLHVPRSTVSSYLLRHRGNGSAPSEKHPSEPPPKS